MLAYSKKMRGFNKFRSMEVGEHIEVPLLVKATKLPYPVKLAVRSNK